MITKEVEEPSEQDLKDNPYIDYALENGIPINSFVKPGDIDPLCPPPLYFTEEEMTKPLATDKKEIFKGLEETKIGTLICTDKEAMDRQKGILVDVVK